MFATATKPPEALPRREADPRVVEAMRALNDAARALGVARAREDDARQRSVSTNLIVALRARYELPEREKDRGLAEAQHHEATDALREARAEAAERLRGPYEARLREHLAALDRAYERTFAVFNEARALIAEAQECQIGKATDFDLLQPGFFLGGDPAQESGLSIWRRVLRRDGWL